MSTRQAMLVLIIIFLVLVGVFIYFYKNLNYIEVDAIKKGQDITDQQKEGAEEAETIEETEEMTIVKEEVKKIIEDGTTAGEDESEIRQDIIQYQSSALRKKDSDVGSDADSLKRDIMTEELDNQLRLE